MHYEEGETARVAAPCSSCRRQSSRPAAHAHAIAATQAVLFLKLHKISLAHRALVKRLVGAKKCDLAFDPSLCSTVVSLFYPALWPCIGQLRQSQRLFSSYCKIEQRKGTTSFNVQPRWRTNLRCGHHRLGHNNVPVEFRGSIAAVPRGVGNSASKKMPGWGSPACFAGRKKGGDGADAPQV